MILIGECLVSDITKAGKLSFFQVDRYRHAHYAECDFSSAPRPHFCMGLILDGEGDFFYDATCVTVREGDIIFVPVGSTYVSKWCGSPEIHYISVHFSFDFPGPFPRSAKMNIQKMRLEHHEALRQIYENMLSGFCREKPMQLSVLGDFYKLLSLVYPNLQFMKNEELDDRIAKAVAYIEYHAKEDFKIEDLAKLCNMSTSHFHACFKEALGQSPIEYKNGVSIRHAELMLLADSKKSIEAISEELGFSSSVYFRELFKKITGKTPREYRKTKIE